MTKYIFFFLVCLQGIAQSRFDSLANQELRFIDFAYMSNDDVVYQGFIRDFRTTQKGLLFLVILLIN
jgi:hypothetical protein